MKRRLASASTSSSNKEGPRDENARLSALVRELRLQLVAERKLRHELKMKVLAVLREEGVTKLGAPKRSQARQGNR